VSPSGKPIESPGEGDSSNDDVLLPKEVQALQPRMRQVATIVYLRGGASVRDIQDELGGYSSGGVRTMLGRLQSKGILRCRPGSRPPEQFYIPAIVTDEVRDHALKRLIDKHFDGAVDAALQQTLQLISRRSADE
jgi:predicted transcriptional regulator